MANREYSADSALHLHPPSWSEAAVGSDKPQASAYPGAMSPGVRHLQSKKRLHGTRVPLGQPARAPANPTNPLIRN
jgi:hypothetical protein